jgi:hypothetical protein
MEQAQCRVPEESGCGKRTATARMSKMTNSGGASVGAHTTGWDVDRAGWVGEAFREETSVTHTRNLQVSMSPPSPELAVASACANRRTEPALKHVIVLHQIAARGARPLRQMLMLHASWGRRCSSMPCVCQNLSHALVTQPTTQVC